MNIAERERLSRLYGEVATLEKTVEDQGKRLEEITAQVKQLNEKRPVGRPPKDAGL